MSHIVVIGSDGNMGQRYMGWLRALGALAVGLDLNSTQEEWAKYLEKAKGVIIATPTDLHVPHIVGVKLRNPTAPILVEKALSRDADGLVKYVLPSWESAGFNIQMVDQYALMPRIPRYGPEVTFYESHHSGKDGIAWDCINIIGKASNPRTVRLENHHKEGHWKCCINGSMLHLGHMPQAYKDMVKAWLDDPMPNYDYMKTAHLKVKEYIEWSQGITAETTGS